MNTILGFYITAGKDENTTKKFEIYVMDKDESYLTYKQRDKIYFLNRRTNDYRKFSYTDLENELYYLTDETIGPNEYPVLKKVDKDWFKVEKVEETINGNKVIKTMVQINSQEVGLSAGKKGIENKIYYYIYRTDAKEWIQFNINDFELKFYETEVEKEVEKTNGKYKLKPGKKYQMKIIEYYDDETVKGTYTFNNIYKDKYTAALNFTDETKKEQRKMYVCDLDEGYLSVDDNATGEIEFTVYMARKYKNDYGPVSNIMLKAYLEVATNSTGDDYGEDKWEDALNGAKDTVNVVKDAAKDAAKDAVNGGLNKDKVDETLKYKLTMNYNGGKDDKGNDYGIAYDNPNDPNKYTIVKDTVYVVLDNEKGYEERTITRDGYTFKGWASTADAGKPDYNENDVVSTEDGPKTIYAVWEANEPQDKGEDKGENVTDFMFSGIIQMIIEMIIKIITEIDWATVISTGTSIVSGIIGSISGS